MFSLKRLFACGLMTASSALLGAQMPSMMSMPQPKEQKPAEVKLADLKEKSFHYDVVSIKPHKAGDLSMAWRSTSDGFAFVNMPLDNLVKSAYGIKLDDALIGMPKWGEDRYDVEAKMDEETAALEKKLSRADRRKLQQMLMQDLVADRLKFKAHTETRQLAAYDLVIAKGGVKMKESAPDGKAMLTVGRGKFEGAGFEVANLADNLTSNIGKTVVDKTGLAGKKFDFSLNYTPDEQQGTPDAGPSLFTAIEEQLGLKLVASKAMVEVVVVDHIERPSEN